MHVKLAINRHARYKPCGIYYSLLLLYFSVN